MGVNSLPKTVTRQRRDCDLNPGPSAPESSTLTTRLPSHPHVPTFSKWTRPRHPSTTLSLNFADDNRRYRHALHAKWEWLTSRRKTTCSLYNDDHYFQRRELVGGLYNIVWRRLCDIIASYSTTILCMEQLQTPTVIVIVKTAGLPGLKPIDGLPPNRSYSVLVLTGY